MRRIALFSVLSFFGVAALFLLFGQQRSVTPANAYEIMSVLPHEQGGGQYKQVEQRELETLAEQGWELVGVTPYVYRNEEQPGLDSHGLKPVVTQTYPAYFFKRIRLSRY